MVDNLEQLDLPEFNFDNTFANLSARFYSRLPPTPVPAPTLIKLNNKLADVLGLDSADLRTEPGIQVLSGNCLPRGSDPIAMVYAGHQFGGWVPQLGDGRAILLGEVLGKDGIRRDIQLKGAGPTPYSRMGDGRAALGPVLREYIVSEAISALGIPTTRSLAAVSTGDMVMREQALPGAIIARVAESHIRVGTFQYFFAQSDHTGLKELADYVIARYFPTISDDTNKYASLLAEVVRRQAELIAQWQLVGFIHGVMNTDNSSIIGETIDYGPCAFLDKYDPQKVFSSIDQQGRYAYANQPGIGYWNLACFGQALAPLMGADNAASLSLIQELIAQYPALFEEYYSMGLNKKLGLQTRQEGDKKLAEDLLDEMVKWGADYTVTFRKLAEIANKHQSDGESRKGFFVNSRVMRDWVQRWRKRLSRDGDHPLSYFDILQLSNPAYIARNHLIEEVIEFAVSEGNYSHFHELVKVLENPFEESNSSSRYALPPTQEQEVTETFCGT